MTHLLLSYMKTETYGLIYKGSFCPLWGGLYVANSGEFDHGAIPNVSRTIKAQKHDAAVVVLYED